MYVSAKGDFSYRMKMAKRGVKYTILVREETQPAASILSKRPS
jgi:hypothetical protein